MPSWQEKGGASRDFIGVSRRSSLYLLGLVLTRSIGLLLVPLFTRLLVPSDYGILSAITSISSVATILYTFGLRGAFSRLYWDHTESRNEQGELLGSVLACVLLISIFATGLLYIGGENFFGAILKGVPFDPYVRMGLLLALFSVVPPFWTTYCRIRERAATYVLFTSGTFLATTALSIYLVAFAQQGVLGRLRSLLLIQAILTLVSLVFLRKEFPLRFSLQKLKASLRYGLAYIPHNLSGWVMGLLDRLLLGGIRGFDSVGIYNVGYALGGVMGMIAVAFNLSYTPYFMKKFKQEGERAAHTISRLATLWFIIMVFLALCISVFAREIVTLMAARSYQEAWRVIPIVVLGFFCQGVYFMTVKPIIQNKRFIRYLPVGSFSGGIVNLVGNLLLIPRFGMVGAAWATMISYFSMMAIAFMIARRALRIPYEYPKLARAVLVGVILYMGVLCGEQLGVTWWVRALLKAMLVFLYPLLLEVLGVVRMKDLLGFLRSAVADVSLAKTNKSRVSNDGKGSNKNLGE